jgi:hypothetical protein
MSGWFFQRLEMLKVSVVNVESLFQVTKFSPNDCRFVDREFPERDSSMEAKGLHG